MIMNGNDVATDAFDVDKNILPRLKDDRVNFTKVITSSTNFTKKRILYKNALKFDSKKILPFFYDFHNRESIFD